MVEDVRVRPRVLAFSRWLRVEWRAEEMVESMALLDSRPGDIWDLDMVQQSLRAPPPTPPLCLPCYLCGCSFLLLF